MKKIFENNYIIITIAKEVAKDFEYLEDFLEVYNDSFEDVETLEELEEVENLNSLIHEYADEATPVYDWNVSEEFHEMDKKYEIDDTFEYIKDIFGGFDCVLDINKINFTEFQRILICINIERKLYQEFYKFLEVAKVEDNITECDFIDLKDDIIFHLESYHDIDIKRMSKEYAETNNNDVLYGLLDYICTVRYCSYQAVGYGKDLKGWKVFNYYRERICKNKEIQKAVKEYAKI